MLSIEFGKVVKVIDGVVTDANGGSAVVSLREGDEATFNVRLKDDSEANVHGKIAKLEPKAMLIDIDASELPVYVEYAQVLEIGFDEEE